MASAPTDRFDQEKIDLYQTALEFLAWVTRPWVNLDERCSSRTREVCDRLDRASLSVSPNNAEGNETHPPKIRATFFDHATGLATECAACLQAFVATLAGTKENIAPGKQLLPGMVSIGSSGPRGIGHAQR